MLPTATTGFPIEAMVLGIVALFIRPLTFKGLHNWPQDITGQPPRRRVGPKSFFASARPQAAHQPHP